MRLTRLIPALAISLCATAALAAEYNATEAAQHVGEEATVTDKVARVNVASGGNIFIDLGGAHPSAPFTIFISAKLADQFPDAKSYQGKTISVTGKITTHKDKPQIAPTAPSQISVKDDAPTPGGTSGAAASTTPSPSPRK